MTETSGVRNISDTALWVAVYRARESERKDALFKDPFARRLAGTRGEEIAANTMRSADRHSWAFVIRTFLIDRIITELVDQGTDMVVNLAAGLDARPYRMSLPSTLKWIEIDLPEIISYKEEILADDKPICSLQRIALDLSDIDARRNLFRQLDQESKKALIVTEGILIYLSADEVGSLAKDLAAATGVQRWIIDLATPALLKMIQKEIGDPLSKARAPLKFAPEEGTRFFEQHGWTAIEIQSLLPAAARAKRIPFWMRLIASLPDSKGQNSSRPWSGVCLLGKNIS